MKALKIVLLVILTVTYSVSCQNKQTSQFVGSDSISKLRNSQDSIVSGNISEEYSGIYKGKISVNTSPTGFELVDGWIAFDFSENKKIVLYDGNFLEDNLISNNEIKGLGRFSESNNRKGFLLDFMETDLEPNNIKQIFLEKKGDMEAAKEIINKYKEEKELFEKFYAKFKQELLNKEFKKIAAYGNFPIKDFSDNSKIYNQGQFEKKLKSVFNEEFYKNNYHIESLNDLPLRFEDHYPGKEGIYMLQTIIYINFKKIGDDIKIVSISHPYD